jgi:hypothetical protein
LRRQDELLYLNAPAHAVRNENVYETFHSDLAQCAVDIAAASTPVANGKEYAGARDDEAPAKRNPVLSSYSKYIL